MTPVRLPGAPEPPPLAMIAHASRPSGP